jgi:protein phosphatase
MDNNQSKLPDTIGQAGGLPGITTSQEDSCAISQVFPRQLTAGCAQSVGLQRSHNEDALFALTTLLSSNQQHIPFGLYMVADGMGGHDFGEVASAAAVRVVAEAVTRQVFQSLFSPDHATPGSSLQEILGNSVSEANQAVLRLAPGGGTTLTAVMILGDQMIIAHVGDSRLYQVFPDGSITPLTRDHSLVSQLVEVGMVTEEQAATHPQRNILLRAIGQPDSLEIDLFTLPVPPIARLLICSDGLWGVVPRSDLAALVFSCNDLPLACQRLVDAANAAGGPDNISAILVRMPG